MSGSGTLLQALLDASARPDADFKIVAVGSEQTEAYGLTRALEAGVLVAGRKTLPCRARLLEPQPQVPPRDPPIR